MTADDESGMRQRAEEMAREALCRIRIGNGSPQAHQYVVTITVDTMLAFAAEQRADGAREMREKLIAQLTYVRQLQESNRVAGNETTENCYRIQGNTIEWAIEQLPAESAKPICKYGDPACPCNDGDECNYEGDNPMKPPAESAGDGAAK